MRSSILSASRSRRWSPWLVLAALVVVLPALATAQPSPATPPALADLEEGQVVSGFETAALYLDDRDDPMGGRFVHLRTGFVLDLLRIESVPQAFIWVQSIPDSDRGEPHTQEHLLLGKGNRGRAVASLESMFLADSSAFTQRVRTAYHMHATVGWPAFLTVLEARLDSLLYPDYSDEEIRREVHNYSVTTDAETGTLALEEGGTVYNEMVTSYGRADYLMWRQMTSTLYGPEHPLARASGGIPSGIREMTPEHIRDFHRRHYRLDNMGMIGAFDSRAPYHERLAELDELLARISRDRPLEPLDVIQLDTLPAPAPAASHEPIAVRYPSGEAQDAVDVEIVWPAARDLSMSERVLFETFLGTFAGEAGTNLHGIFVDSATVEIDLGTTGVAAGALEWPGLPMYMTLSGVNSAQIDGATANRIRDRVQEELRAVADAAPGDARLADFQRRARSQLVASQRRTRSMVDSPPGFGIRGTYATWIEHLEALDRAALDSGGQFRRSLTRRDAAAEAEAVLSADDNPWTERLRTWGLLGTEPYILYGAPSPALAEALEGERAARLAAQVQVLQTTYETDDDQVAIARYRDDYAVRTAELEAVAAQVTVPPFVDTPPMTMDDAITASATAIGDVPVVVSTFQNMSGATAGIALDLRGVTEEDLLLLSLLPALVRRTGVADGAGVVPYVEMVERLQNEILDLDVGFAGDPVTGRVELTVSASGTTPVETVAALGWAERSLFHADWRAENLPRLRDVVDEALDTLRRTTQQGEERWVNDPARAFRYQRDPVYLATHSFMTRTHHALRLRWLLTPPDAAATADLETIVGLIDGLTAGTFDRETLESFFETPEGADGPMILTLHPPSAAGDAIVREAVRDLALTLGDLPEDGFAADLAYVARQILADYRVPPEDTLYRLVDLRQRLLRRSGARLWEVGASLTLAELEAPLTSLVARLSEGTPERLANDGEPLINDRLLARSGPAGPDSGDEPVPPVFVGLVNPDTRGGVHMHSAPVAHYLDYDEEGLLDFLTGRMYGGGGAHSLFMKTWGAGLAYSNGVRADAVRGTLRYYAERCPELPQTLQFVIGELSGVAEDPGLQEYALSQVFESRASRDYAVRGAALAADLADGRTPEVIRAFREAMLALRDREGLSAELFSRMEAVYGRILPGWGPASAAVEGAVYYVIGPDVQLDAWESYLHAVEGDDARLYRVYARDYWMTGPEDR